MTLNDWLVATVCAALVFSGGFAVGFAWAEERLREAGEARERFEDHLARCRK